MRLNAVPERNLTTNNNDLHLLSINEVRKILKLRHSTVNDLVQQGKIKSMKINNRIKVPEFRLQEFIIENSQTNCSEKMQRHTSNLNDQINDLINKRKGR
ncbi:MAG: helix-turn-helix domain-containing protein [Ignavibacteria bacterium]|nr:helix-turn-helix domain-containing protein [Ignavibacteria bacterium]